MISNEELERLRKAREPRPKKQKTPIRRKVPVHKGSIREDNGDVGEGLGEVLDATRKGKFEAFFVSVRPLMSGMCQCGCGQPSSRNSDQYFRHSIAHIFPKKNFKSVAKHPEVWVERRFWGGCHSNMDNRSIEKWPNMADWPEIKRKFYILAPLLTEKEKGYKFYKQLSALVYLH